MRSMVEGAPGDAIYAIGRAANDRGRTFMRSCRSCLASAFDARAPNLYIRVVDISCDPTKREETLEERGLDFLDAVEVFEGEIVFEAEDDRRDYGETRIITVGFLRGRMVVVGWTPRGVTRHVFSMRKANAREQARSRK